MVEPVTSPSEEQRAAERAFAIFSFLWAAAALFHRAQYANWARGPMELGESFCALLLLMRPGSLRAFLALVAFQVAQNAILMPHISNHTLLGLFMAFSIVVCTVWLLATGRFSKAALYRSFAPILRIELLVFYFWVVFHKLNPDFFVPDVSCAVSLMDKLARALSLPVNPSWARGLAIYGTLAIEAAIPVLLVLRSTRSAGILLGMGFHFMVALATFYDFSSLLFACFFLFVPQNHPELLERWWQGIRERARPAALWRLAKSPAWQSGLLAVALVILVFSLGSSDWSTTPKLAWILWWIYGLSVIALCALPIALGPAECRPAAKLLAVRPRALLALPLLVFLNGASPHLGFKTENSFAMFSNLRTEGGENNHYLVPAGIQVFDFQRDLIVLHSSSDASLTHRARFGGQLTYATLRTRVAQLAAEQRKGVSLRFDRAGKRYDLPNAERDPELSKPYPLPLRKVLWFREIVNERTKVFCRH